MLNSIENGTTYWVRKFPVEISGECSILVEPNGGRLTNQIFMLASGLGLSLAHSCDLILNENLILKLNETFALDLTEFRATKDLSQYNNMTTVSNVCTFHSSLLQHGSPQHIRMVGYWASYFYFIDYMTEVRKQFRFRPEILNIVDEFLQLNLKKEIRVAVHNRRGDYATVINTSSQEYFFRGMDYFRKRYRNPKFIVVSDDKAFCRRIFANQSDVLVTPDSFRPGDDLAIMARSDHAIISLGTYGWWGAMLLRNLHGEVISDSKPGFQLLENNCPPKDRFPPWFLTFDGTNLVHFPYFD